MDLNEEILNELKTLNSKMDQLITAVNRSRAMPTSIPQVPQMPNANMPNMASMVPQMGFPQVPDAGNIRKTVEERIRKAREEADAKMAQLQAGRIED